MKQVPLDESVSSSLLYLAQLSELERFSTHSSDSGTTLGQHAQPGDDILDPLDTVGDLLNVSAELLSKSQGGSILQVSSTDLDDRLELSSLGLEGIVKLVKSGQESVVDLDNSRDVHGGGEAVNIEAAMSFHPVGR
jgi:hypothetical protein